MLRSETSRDNAKVKGRPRSEVLDSTPFFKTFQPLTLPINRDQLLTDCNHNESSRENLSLEESTKAVDLPSIEFETALEGKTIPLTSNGNLEPFFPRQEVTAGGELNDILPSADSNISEGQRPEGSTDTKDIANAFNLKVIDGSYKQLQAVKVEENEIQTKDKTDKLLKALLHTDANLPFEKVKKHKSESDSNSTASSVVDTGFSSFGEAGNSQLSAEVAESDSDSEVMRNARSSARSTAKVIPTPLRACYYNAYEISSYDGVSRDSSLTSKASVSSVSAIDSEDDPASDYVSNSSGSPVKNCRTSPNADFRKVHKVQTSQTQTVSAAVKLKNADKPLRQKGSFQVHKLSFKNKAVSENKSSQNKSGFLENEYKFKVKDDNDAVLATHGDVTINKHSFHGTWPRRAASSKRKRNQAEADELLRKFRETADIYRAKFRDIYAETRRKIEETMFSLRVAVAKSGYSSKYYSTQTSVASDSGA